MMSGWRSGMDPGWWVLMSVLWLVLIGLIVWAAVRLFPRDSQRSADIAPPAGGDDAKAILDRRLAAGGKVIVHFPKAGTYVIGTHVFDLKGMPAMPTSGPDNVLKLTVVVS